ncbi:MAG: hypothetical protein P8N09_05600 [Planctomycetota bacterium]|nr:hypothetical protein [Planctomycetota bacterium]
MTSWVRLSVLSLLLFSGACAGVDTYARSRVADFKDVFPWSVACGWGIGLSMQATPLFELGVGLTTIHSNRWGYDDRIVHGVWRESVVLFPYTLWNQALEPDPQHPETTGFPWTAIPIVYRWQIFRDGPGIEGQRNRNLEPNFMGWGRHPPIVRESLGAFIFPATRRWVDFTDVRKDQGDPGVLSILGTPERATLWEARRAGRPAARAWDLFEVDFFALVVGARLGVRPVEAVDFVLGIFGVDFLKDDLPEPHVNVPEKKPLPAAS